MRTQDLSVRIFMSLQPLGCFAVHQCQLDVFVCIQASELIILLQVLMSGVQFKFTQGCVSQSVMIAVDALRVPAAER